MFVALWVEWNLCIEMLVNVKSTWQIKLDCVLQTLHHACRRSTWFFSSARPAPAFSPSFSANRMNVCKQTTDWANIDAACATEQKATRKDFFLRTGTAIRCYFPKTKALFVCSISVFPLPPSARYHPPAPGGKQSCRQMQKSHSALYCFPLTFEYLNGAFEIEIFPNFHTLCIHPDS